MLLVFLTTMAFTFVNSQVTFEQCTWEGGYDDCMIFDYELPNYLFNYLETNPNVLEIFYDPAIDMTRVIFDGFGTNAEDKAKKFDFAKRYNDAFTENYAGPYQRPCLVDEVTGELWSYHLENGQFVLEEDDPRCSA